MGRLSRLVRSLTGALGSNDLVVELEDPEDPVDRARVSFEALERSFAVRGQPSLYRDATPWSANRCSYLWPFSRAAAAALDLVELGVVEPARADQLLGDGLARYRRDSGTIPAYDSAVRPPLGGGGDRFYDDNAWIGLDLVRQHEVTGAPDALARAVDVFAFLVSGWDADSSHPSPGGVFWVESSTNGDRNTVSTVPAARLGFLLQSLGAGPPDTGAWAERMLQWTHTTLRDPADGLYWDHIALDGDIERTKWSYNQGNVIGAELARSADAVADGPPPLARAEAIATAALDRYAGPGGGLAGQGHPFNAIFFRSLMDLRSVTADAALAARILDTVTGYADATWVSGRGRDGLFRASNAGRSANLIDQAAMVEILALTAGATGPRAGPVASS